MLSFNESKSFVEGRSTNGEMETQGNTLKDTWNGLQIGTGIGDNTQQ